MLSTNGGVAVNGSNGDVNGGSHSSTTSSTSSEMHGSHLALNMHRSKDDTCTQTRVRHPTDRGYCPAAAPLSPTLVTNGNHFFDISSDACRSRAYSANARPIVTRMNVYKRAEIPIFPTKDFDEKNSAGRSKHCADNNGCEPAESPTKIFPKRESWLQKSWKAHRPIQKDQKPQTIQMTNSVGTSGPLSGFWGRLRPRANSDAAANAMVSQSPSTLATYKKNGSKVGSICSSTESSRKGSGGIDCDDEDGHIFNMDKALPRMSMVCYHF